jgi:diguanylate cyclase (GGDEF)-like protein
MKSENRSSILIVDDVPANIHLLAEALRADHYIRVATNGPDAIQVSRQSPQPDLILLDAMMPDMDGFEVCRRLKESPETQNIPIVFVTAKDDAISEERGLGLGALDYITKPFNLPIVRARVRNYLALKHKTDLLESMAHVDSLTNVANRRRFNETLDIEWRRCVRGKLPLSLLMIDVDHFKAYNDRFGHSGGDACLTAVAATLAAELVRPADLIARFGGEEFSVVLPETMAEGARQTAERLRLAVLAKDFSNGADETPRLVTISIGCATLNPSEKLQPSDLINTADKKLYQAKSEGRNRVRA